MTPEEMKRKLRVLGAIEGAGGDISENSVDEVIPSDAIEIAGPPVRQPLTPRPPGVIVERLPQVPEADTELTAARSGDVNSFNDRATETALRQIVGGITRTKVPDSVTQLGTGEKDLLGRRRQARLTALQEMELGRNAGNDTYRREKDAKDEAYRTTKDASDAKYRQTEADENQVIRREGIGASKAAADAMRMLAGANFGLRKEESDVKKTERDDKKAASAVPVLGGTLTLTPGLSDTERGKAREVGGLWNSADEAVANFQTTLEEFARAPSSESKGRVTAALRTASSAFNSAIGGGAMSADEARAMSEAMGADILSPSGLQALAQSVLGDDGKAAATISNRVRAARQANRAAALGRLKTYGTFTDGGATAGGHEAAASGKVTVTNGKETLEIDAGDVADAEKDGYRRVGQ